jgi:hypothetical protein
MTGEIRLFLGGRAQRTGVIAAFCVRQLDGCGASWVCGGWKILEIRRGDGMRGHKQQTDKEGCSHDEYQ